MTSIAADDQVFLAAERMTDLDDGGGYPSATVILDNVDNNGFPDIASGDRISGRTWLRKIFAAIRNPDTEPLLASRCYIATPPSDPNVSVALLVTGVASDTRSDAVETLYTAAQQNLNTNLRIYQDYYEGESTIAVYYFTDQSAAFIGIWPAIGDVIYLEDDTAGTSQYVRVSSISISNLVGTYQTATITISPPLKATFRGSFNTNTSYVTPTQLYTTRSIPMAYGIYGISPLSVAATADDVDVVLDRIETPIAPIITEIVDASFRPSSDEVLATKTVAAVNGKLQSTTINPMPDLDTISVRVNYLSGYSVIKGSVSPGLFAVAGTSITVTLQTAIALTVNQSGYHTVISSDVDSWIISPRGAGITAGSVNFSIFSPTGQTLLDETTDDGLGAFSGTLSTGETYTGTINYTTGVVSITFSAPVYVYIYYNYVYTDNTQSLVWEYGSAITSDDAFNFTLNEHVIAGSFQAVANATSDSSLLTASDDGSGALTGDATGILTYETGVLQITWDEAVDVDSIVLVYQYHAPSSIDQVVGGTLDAVRLPSSKSYPLVRAGDKVIIHHPIGEILTNPVVAETTYALSRANVQQIWLEDATGTRIPTAKYTVDLVAGEVTMATGLDLTGYTQPLTAFTSIEEEALVTSIDSLSKTVRLNRALNHSYPAFSAYLSAQVDMGDLASTITVPFAQSAWTAVWSDVLIGSAISPQLNHSAYPPVVTNDGSITERWRIQFTSTTTVNVIGEHVGQIASNLSITSDIAPINPYTSLPYFTIPNEGWGAGWANGNLLRFNTTGADFPLWMIRCVQPSEGPAPGTTDRFRLAFVGDVDA